MFRINRLKFKLLQFKQKIIAFIFLVPSEIIYYAFLQIDWLRERSVSARQDSAIFNAVDPVPFYF
jgi:hypothetical protein